MSVSAVGANDAAGAMKLLEKALNDQDYNVRKNAVETLEKKLNIRVRGYF